MKDTTHLAENKLKRLAASVVSLKVRYLSRMYQLKLLSDMPHCRIYDKRKCVNNMSN